MTPQRRHAAVIVVVALAAVTSAAIGTTHVLGPADADARVSNRGTLATPNAEDRRILEKGGFKNEIYLLKTSAGRYFARVERADGTECFATSARPHRTLLGMVVCDPKFPAQRPVLDFSVYGADAGSELRVVRALGIVADGVAEVRLLTASGEVLRTVPVEDNVYSLDAPELDGVTAHSAVAVDEGGETVARLGPSR